MKREVIVYKGEGGAVRLPYDIEMETIWASQAQIAEVFGVTPQNITVHLKKIYQTKELFERATCKENLQVQIEGGREVQRKTRVYNLDVILSVGYRVNSKRATDFRKWANEVLRKYIVDGVAVNEGRLKQLEVKKLRGVEGVMGVVRRLIESKELEASEANGVLEVITRYANSWELLERYDEGRIVFGGRGRKARWTISVERSFEMIGELRRDIGAGELFGKVRGGGLEGVIGAVYQSFGGRDLYDSVAEKAANLLYLVVKDHPFYDGNKRIGAFLFVMFLTMNDYYLDRDGECKISDRALVAITLMIAESEPKEKELMVALTGKLLE